ncbi:MAG: esterase-like activity of phytase family protein [Hyphomicrobiales bacterium]
MIAGLPVWPRCWLGGLAISAVLLGPALAKNPVPVVSPGFTPIEITVSPVSFDRIDPDHQRFGALVWRGGIEISSPNEGFGGFSDISLNREGNQVLAISDEGRWLSAGLTYEGGQLTGLDHAGMAKMTGSQGQALGPKQWSDAEAMATGPQGLDGPIWVAFERWHRVETYRLGQSGSLVWQKRLRLPPDIASAPVNQGIEAMTLLGPNTAAQGSLLVVTEGVRDGAGDSVAWLLGGKNPGRLTVLRDEDYVVTEAVSLPNGDVVLLERHLGSLINFSIRLRRIKAGDIRPGARLQGQTLFEGGLRYAIDNMEGLAVSTMPDGEVRLTLISDDNFSRFQRTLILQFALAETATN